MGAYTLGIALELGSQLRELRYDGFNIFSVTKNRGIEIQRLCVLKRECAGREGVPVGFTFRGVRLQPYLLRIVLSETAS